MSSAPSSLTATPVMPHSLSRLTQGFSGFINPLRENLHPIVQMADSLEDQAGSHVAQHVMIFTLGLLLLPFFEVIQTLPCLLSLLIVLIIPPFLYTHLSTLISL